MSTTTNVKQTKLNIMTQSQYNSATKNATELYMVIDAQISYNDLSNKPTIPTVNNATLTIQKNGTTVNSFTANASSDVTANITVPTDTSDLTNGAGFITAASLPTVNNGTLTIQANGTTVGTFTANQEGNTTANIVVPDSATWGNITGTLSNQTDLQNALNAKQATLVSGTNIKTINSNSILGSGDLVLDGLPSQTGQSGKFLTTDGTDASWGNLPIATSSTVGVVKPDNASIRVSNDGTLSAICRNVGEIISSTLPLTDAGLHLLDGSLILGGGIYQGFVDYIADLYTANPSANYFTTEALWQTAVNTYGVCGKFVYDSVNNTVRLPKIIGIIEGTTDVTALGDLVEAGLPNITGYTQQVRGVHLEDIPSGALDWSIEGNDTWGGYGVGNIGRFTIDASNSNSIYGNSSTVQPQTIKVLYYIVIATTTKTDIEVDIDQVATDLNGKTDVDLSNTTDTGYIKMAGAGMPSDNYIDLTLGASGTRYTAPADGYYTVSAGTTATNGYIRCVNNSTNIGTISQLNVTSANLRIFIPVKRNDSITLTYSNVGSIGFRFIYAVGSESEAS